MKIVWFMPESEILEFNEIKKDDFSYLVPPKKRTSTKSE
jgi:hypothetical protein